MTEDIKDKLIDWAIKYNDPVYFQQDPIAFPKEFAKRGSSLRDIEIAAVFSAHFAWGRRAMIVRDLERFFNFMEWKPAEYLAAGDYRNDETSIHRTIKWSETAKIFEALKDFYTQNDSLESLSATQMRERIFGQKEDPKAANKKINMLRRWMVRNDGIVDMGLWKNSSAAELIIPLDVHVYSQAAELGLTARKQKDILTAVQITDQFRQIWPDDPVRGDFALFGYGVSNA